METRKLFVRKSDNSNTYIAYGYIKIPYGGWSQEKYRNSMVWFTGNSFTDAITKALQY